MNMDSLWNRTCQLLSQSVASVSYNTWIESNLSPAALEEDTLILSAAARWDPAGKKTTIPI